LNWALQRKVELLDAAVSPVSAYATGAGENLLMRSPRASPITAGGRSIGRRSACTSPALSASAISSQPDALIHRRYEITARPGEKRFSGWTDGLMRNAHQGLAMLEKEDICPAAPSARSPPPACWAIAISAFQTTAGGDDIPNHTFRVVQGCRGAALDASKKARGGVTATSA